LVALAALSQAPTLPAPTAAMQPRSGTSTAATTSPHLGLLRPRARSSSLLARTPSTSVRSATAVTAVSLHRRPHVILLRPVYRYRNCRSVPRGKQYLRCLWRIHRGSRHSLRRQLHCRCGQHPGRLELGGRQWRLCGPGRQCRARSVVFGHILQGPPEHRHHR
jgi:hypothetical protein